MRVVREFVHTFNGAILTISVSPSLALMCMDARTSLSQDTKERPIAKRSSLTKRCGVLPTPIDLHPTLPHFGRVSKLIKNKSLRPLYSDYLNYFCYESGSVINQLVKTLQTFCQGSIKNNASMGICVPTQIKSIGRNTSLRLLVFQSQ
jgi:hypothetical protein